MELEAEREVETAAWLEILDLAGLDGVLNVELRLHVRFDLDEPSDGDADDVYLLAPNYQGFMPEFFPMRLLSGTRHLDKVVRVNRKTGKVWVFMQGRLTFKQDMDYLLFPMDKQVLQVELRSNNCMMVPWKEDKRILGFVGDQEIDIKLAHPDQEKGSAQRLAAMFKGAAHLRNIFKTTAKKSNTVPIVVAAGSPRDWSLEGLHYTLEPYGEFGVSAYCSSLQVFILVRRVAVSYFWNYFVSMYIIVITLHLGAFVDVRELVARNGAISSVLLLIIANRFRFTADIPHVNYMTFMDWYLFMSFCLPIAAFLMNISLSEFDFGDDADPNLENIDKAEAIDLNFHVTVFTFWSVFHVVLGLYIWGRERHMLFVDWIEKGLNCVLSFGRSPIPFSHNHHVEAVGAVDARDIPDHHSQRKL